VLSKPLKTTGAHNQLRFKVPPRNPQGLFENGIQADERCRPRFGNRADHVGRRDWEPCPNTATVLSVIPRTCSGPLLRPYFHSTLSQMLSDVIGVYFRHQKAPGGEFVERGDYQLVQGSRKKIVGPMEWTQIEKLGLKVEMSIIIRTRDQDEATCPSCNTRFEGSAVEGWAQW
jgi:hypothetical protein